MKKEPPVGQKACAGGDKHGERASRNVKNQDRRKPAERAEEGIYHVEGADIPIQFILLYKLSRKNNLWLRSIGGKLSKREEAVELIQEYKKHKKDERYREELFRKYEI